MLKKIKIIGDVYTKDNINMAGQVVDALITKGDGCETATFNNGHDYPVAFTHYSNQDQIAYFEIVSDVFDNNAVDALDNLRGEFKQQSDKLQNAYETISDLQDDIEKVKATANDKIKRDHINGGYVIIPASFLDQELADEFKSNEHCIITPKELVAMCASAQLEINKGDVRPTSLNVKLYNAINGFAQDELDSMIEAGKSGQA